MYADMEPRRIVQSSISGGVAEGPVPGEKTESQFSELNPRDKLRVVVTSIDRSHVGVHVHGRGRRCALRRTLWEIGARDARRRRLPRRPQTCNLATYDRNLQREKASKIQLRC